MVAVGIPSRVIDTVCCASDAFPVTGKLRGAACTGTGLPREGVSERLISRVGLELGCAVASVVHSRLTCKVRRFAQLGQGTLLEECKT